MIQLRAIWRGLRDTLARPAWLGQRRPGTGPAARPPEGGSAVMEAVINPAGSQPGWLRVLDQDQLLRSVRADKALREIWRQSRLPAQAWRRDCLPALCRYAEFVQLVPASEAHHHAHAGGLLSHTIEMLLAAMTWRNGHLLPAGEPIEVIDAQRDEWTYVVFFAALMHDIAKTMTDLRIQWRARDMAEPLRWIPLAGSLRQITLGRAEAEYLVDFTPKSARDYTAHSRLAMMLLPGIAPATALNFLARQPRAFEALNQYLTGEDKDSLLARIIRRADRASTERSLMSGSKARFGTATALPLIDLLMQAIGSMLRAGTVLPLNRSGAAGWVHDGSMWFVAKWLADSVRTWIKAHAPEESVPGDAKNDRLFDTWQEYGCIQVNPASGQAIWYVTVHGAGGEAGTGASVEQGNELEQGAYEHSLTMLRFPLAKLYADAARYPAPMRGRIEVRSKRDRAEAARDDQEQEGAAATPPMATSAATATGADARPDAKRNPAAPAPAERRKPEIVLREPAFNKPRPKPVPAAKPADPEPARVDASAVAAPEPAAWLDADDDASSVARERKDTRKRPQTAFQPVASQPDRGKALPAAAPTSGNPGAERRASVTASALSAALQIAPMLPPTLGRPRADARPVAPATQPAPAPPSAPAPSGPVVLTPPGLPALPRLAGASAPPEPGALAIEFMKWLQGSLASRRMKYNETGAAVHFTSEGMALVSPLIFKNFAREMEPDNDADERGIQVQREVIKAGWHMMGPNKTNIISYEVVGRGGATRSRLSAVVLVEADRWVVPVPPTNPVLKLV